MNIGGIFLVIYWLGINLQIVSDSSLILVLRVLVDESVVVTDSIMARF